MEWYLISGTEGIVGVELGVSFSASLYVRTQEGGTTEVPMQCLMKS